MGSLFSKPKPVNMPEPKPVAPPPVETADQAGEQERRRRRGTGRLGTFLTGELIPEETKKLKLG